MNRFLRLFRFGNGIMGVIGVIVGAFIASGTGITEYAFGIGLSCVIVFIFMAGGNALNDYIDREIDKTAHPDRPVPRGEISPRTALAAGIAMMIVSALLSLLYRDILSTGLVLIAAGLMVSYEVFLKQRGFAGNVTIAALTGMLFLVGGAICGNMYACVPVALMSFFANVGREISKDIEDEESDEGRRTLPMAVGSRAAAGIASVFFIAGVVLSVWPIIEKTLNSFYMLVFLPDAIFIYAAIIVFKNANRAQKSAKIAMLIALAAFIIGVI